MAQIFIEIAEDNTKLAMKIDDVKIEPMQASVVEGLIAALVTVRARMKPGIPRTDPVLGTPSLTSGSMRWWVGSDDLPTQLRLHLLHPGIGWISIPLSKEGVQQLIAALLQSLQTLPPIQ